MRIITPRLVIRPLTEYDASEIALATDETWDDLSKWMRWATDRTLRTNPLNCAAYAKNCHDLFINRKDFSFGGFLKKDNSLALISRLTFQVNHPQNCEFAGYWCRKKYQNTGYMSEAVNALARFAFHHLKTRNIRITHAQGNNKTRSVINKTGFVETDILKNHHKLPDGSSVDEHVLMLWGLSALPPLEITIENP